MKRLSKKVEATLEAMNSADLPKKDKIEYIQSVLELVKIEGRIEKHKELNHGI